MIKTYYYYSVTYSAYDIENISKPYESKEKAIEDMINEAKQKRNKLYENLESNVKLLIDRIDSIAILKNQNGDTITWKLFEKTID